MGPTPEDRFGAGVTITVLGSGGFPGPGSGTQDGTISPDSALHPRVLPRTTSDESWMYTAVQCPWWHSQGSTSCHFPPCILSTFPTARRRTCHFTLIVKDSALHVPHRHGCSRRVGVGFSPPGCSFPWQKSHALPDTVVTHQHLLVDELYLHTSAGRAKPVYILQSQTTLLSRQPAQPLQASTLRLLRA